jgi:hypothetical protein
MTTSDRRAESGHVEDNDREGWFIRVVALLFVLGLLFGPHWSDNTFLGLIFIGVVIALLEGKSLAECLVDGQRQNTLLLEQIAECQRRNILLLERLEAGQQKMSRQQVRDAIALEGIVASLPVHEKAPNHDKLSDAELESYWIERLKAEQQELRGQVSDSAPKNGPSRTIFDLTGR